MSRIGRKPVVIPKGVTVTVTGNTITVKGPKGTLDYTFNDRFTVEVKESTVIFTRPTDHRTDLALHGLIRSLTQNMVMGVTDGYKKELEIRGVGFKAQVQGKKLTMQLGYSHDINYTIPDGITIQAPKQTEVIVSGIDKAKVGEVAAEIRDFCLAEPYKGKGVRYKDEYVRQKAGKKVA